MEETWEIEKMENKYYKGIFVRPPYNDPASRSWTAFVRGFDGKYFDYEFWRSKVDIDEIEEGDIICVSDGVDKYFYKVVSIDYDPDIEVQDKRTSTDVGEIKLEELDEDEVKAMLGDGKEYKAELNEYTMGEYTYYVIKSTTNYFEKKDFFKWIAYITGFYHSGKPKLEFVDDYDIMSHTFKIFEVLDAKWIDDDRTHLVYCGATETEDGETQFYFLRISRSEAQLIDKKIMDYIGHLTIKPTFARDITKHDDPYLNVKEAIRWINSGCGI